MARAAVILDFDGTLCDVRGVRAWGQEAWHKASVSCPPIAAGVAAACEAYEDGHALVVVTARERRFLSYTTAWLEANLPAPVASIYMRRNGDLRGDAVVKRELLDQLRADGYRPVRAFDDHPGCVRMYEAAGIPVTVPGGAEAPAVADAGEQDAVGWRYWHWWSRWPTSLRSPMTWGRPAVTWTPGRVFTADCMKTRHPVVPDAGCDCGVRGVVDLGLMLDYMAIAPDRIDMFSGSPLDSTTRRLNSWLTVGLVVGQVVLGGRTEGPAGDDPPTTIRAEWGRLGGEVYFPRGLWDGADTFEKANPEVVVHRVAELADVPGLVAAGGSNADGTPRNRSDEELLAELHAVLGGTGGHR